MKRRLLYLLFAIIGLFYLGNPSEKQYLQRIAKDFGEVHGGMRIAKEDLAKMGESNYESYLLFSRYSYRFGSIQVLYYGIGFQTFFKSSKRIKAENTLSV